MGPRIRHAPPLRAIQRVSRQHRRVQQREKLETSSKNAANRCYSLCIRWLECFLHGTCWCVFDLAASVKILTGEVTYQGTGKSVLLREIIRRLRARDPAGVSVTATTGIAGLNIQGSTIHSFAGIGLGKEDCRSLARKVKGNFFAKQRWKETQVLIVDEGTHLKPCLLGY